MNRYKLLHISFLIGFIVTRSFVQVLFKSVASGPAGKNYFRMVMDGRFYGGVLLLLASAAFWLSLLKRYPLSRLYPLTSVTVLTLVFCGAIFFNEPISWGNIIGAIVIMAGVVVLGTRKESGIEQDGLF